MSTAIESILPTWQLRLSPFRQMRDPREAKHWGYEAPITSLEAGEEIERFASLTVTADELKQRVKVLSLTQDDPAEREGDPVFGRGFSHPRLWEHYADDHRGVCLCFDRELLTQMVTEGMASDVLHGPVRYIDAEIARDAFRLRLENHLDSSPEEAIVAHFAEHSEELFFTKLRDWETEVEYRFVTLTGDAAPIYIGIRNAVRAIIIGEEVDTHYLPALSALCDLQTVQIHRIKWQHGRPRFIDPREPGYS